MGKKERLVAEESGLSLHHELFIENDASEIKEEPDMETNKEWTRQLTIFIISVTVGYFGLDRFYRGQVGLGILKMITMGAGGVWYLVDAAIAAYRLGKIS